MVVYEDTNWQADRRKNLPHLAILIVAALLLGLYLIFTTVLIAKDGVLYVERARNFANNPIGIIKGDPPAGYSFLIFAAHKFVTLSGGGTSVPMNRDWILSAQCVTLLCRLLAIIPLYFIGRILVGSEKSFWAVLILIMLPYPAEFGSDVLRDWPHIMFLAWGLLFLILGIKSGKWWMFAVAGFIAGFGQMVRSECAQIVIYGVLWLIIGLFLPRPNISRLKILCLMLAILIGFAIPAAPYFRLRGEILPPQLKRLISYDTPLQSSRSEQAGFSCNAVVCTASAASTSADILKALINLAGGISSNMMYFFVVPLVIGFCEQYRRIRKVLLTEWFFIYALLTLYLVIMVLLNVNYGYISKRHSMPMVVFAVFYIPVGLQILASWLNRRTFKSGSAAEENMRLWFFILMAVGFGICAAKFARMTPLRWEKQGYRNAAEWLNKNTAPADIIAVPDFRVTFYAERCYGVAVKSNGDYAADVKYAVHIVKGQGDLKENAPSGMSEIWSSSNKDGTKMLIYGRK